MKDSPHVLLIDGMALLFRGFFATAFTGNFMINSKGTPRNGLFGFLNYFTDAIYRFKPTHVICCWDMGSQTFRNEIYDQYKSNRSAPPEELVPQFELAKDIVTAFDIPNVGVVGYEADDCIGTLAKQIHKNNHVTVVSGDKDLLQLVDDQIDIAIMTKGTGNYDIYNHDNFFEKVGLTPKQFIDLKGLIGDSSDNYPGIKGIGEKTAFKLLHEFETIDNLLENKEHLTKGMQNKFEIYKEDLEISRKLAEINTDVPLTYDLEDSKWNNDHKKIHGFLIDELEFSTPGRWLQKLVD